MKPIKTIEELKDELMNLFEKGEFRKAFFGDRDFYVYQDLEGGHAIGSAIYWYLRWDKSTKKGNIEKIKSILREEFKSNLEVNDYGRLMPISFIVHFLTHIDSSDFPMPFEKDFFGKLLEENLSKFTKEEWGKYKIDRDLEILKKQGLELYIRPPEK